MEQNTKTGKCNESNKIHCIQSNLSTSIHCKQLDQTIRSVVFRTVPYLFIYFPSRHLHQKMVDEFISLYRYCSRNMHIFVCMLFWSQRRGLFSSKLPGVNENFTLNTIPNYVRCNSWTRFSILVTDFTVAGI